MLYNLAKGKAALQSSFSPFSRADEALTAANGKTTGSFSFHTNHESAPWWMVDLGEIAAIGGITIYNRCDAAQDRTRFLSVELFDAAIGGWQPVYRAENEFGGVGYGQPLQLSFGASPKVARFVKIGLDKPGTLHLDQIEISGSWPRSTYQSGIVSNEGQVDFVDAAQDEPSGHPSRGAIVALVRGYKSLDGYSSLIARNKAIFEKINSHALKHYPLIIWHEGDIAPEHQRYIRAAEQNNDVRFVDISARFKLPEGVQCEDLKEHWHLGYRLMCKLHTWDIWQLAAEFDYVLRVDEDCIIKEIIVDPFEWMARLELDCAFSLLVNDSHQLTNETLPMFVEAFTRQYNIPIRSDRPLTSCFPYTNVYMARTAFFRQPHVSRLLRAAVLDRDFYINRWGDHIVLGLALNLFSIDCKIQPIHGIRYGHESHNSEIVGSDDLRQSYISRIRAATTSSSPNSFMEWPLSGRARAEVAAKMRSAGHFLTAESLLADA